MILKRWPVEGDRIVAAGTACVAAGLLVVAFAAWTPALGLVAPVAGSTLAGLGMGLATSSTSLVVMQLSSRGELGRNTSSLQLGEMLGNALLGGLAGTVFAALGPASGPAANVPPIIPPHAGLFQSNRYWRADACGAWASTSSLVGMRNTTSVSTALSISAGAASG